MQLDTIFSSNLKLGTYLEVKKSEIAANKKVNFVQSRNATTPVSMLVYIETASAVNSCALGGGFSGVIKSLSVLELAM